MKKSATLKPARKPRSDAQRNRERILEVAKQVFTRRGADASMGEIAGRSKIGPGTLYRHFATRDDLLATVYITEVEKLAAAQKKLSAKLPPPSRPCEDGYWSSSTTSPRKRLSPRH
jgi:AcrR family transcriptional regulator